MPRFMPVLANTAALAAPPDNGVHIVAASTGFASYLLVWAAVMWGMFLRNGWASTRLRHSTHMGLGLMGLSLALVHGAAQAAAPITATRGPRRLPVERGRPAHLRRFGVHRRRGRCRPGGPGLPGPGGFEVASFVCSTGRTCVLVDPSDRVLGRPLGPMVGALVTDELARQRVDLRLGRRDVARSGVLVSHYGDTGLEGVVAVNALRAFTSMARGLLASSGAAKHAVTEILTPIEASVRTTNEAPRLAAVG